MMGINETTLRQYFPSLSDKSLREEILKVGRLAHFKEAEILMVYGQYIRQIPLLVRGAIRILREDKSGNEIFLYYLNSGETCAISFTCCMTQQRSEVRAIAEEDSEVIFIPVQYMDEWMHEFQSWKNFVMQTYSRRFAELLQTVDNIAFQKLDERLLAYLITRSEAVQSTSISLTHQQIASELHGSREAISRLLKKLEKDGRIRLGRNKIELLKPL
jgi:CRP/FNR family transcriptional regulator